MVLRNLKAEMARAGLTGLDIAAVIGTTEKTARDKINGKTSFSLDQAFKIRDTCFPGQSFEYLFGTDRSDRPMPEDSAGKSA